MSKSPAAILFDQNGNPVAVTLDDGVYKLEFISKLRDSSGTIITPATEATLDAIKDTDGIKKISDPLPAGTNILGYIRIEDWLGSTAPTVGQKVMATSIPVVLASDQNPIETQETKAATSVVTSTTASTSSVTILTSNSSRLGASVHNDSNKNMYLKLGSSASTSSFTVMIERDFYYEVPFNYTGVLTALWDTGVSGNARVTEVTV